MNISLLLIICCDLRFHTEIQRHSRYAFVRGPQIFHKYRSHVNILGASRGKMKQVPYWRPKITGLRRKEFSRPGFMHRCSLSLSLSIYIYIYIYIIFLCCGSEELIFKYSSKKREEFNSAMFHNFFFTKIAKLLSFRQKNYLALNPIPQELYLRIIVRL